MRRPYLQRSRLQRKETDNTPGIAPPIVHDVLRTPGEALDAETRTLFEPGFGHDFSRVRLHTDERARKSAGAVNAAAYTVGNDIVLGEGQKEPHTTEGRQLIAHELTHVVQQTGKTAEPSLPSHGALEVAPSNTSAEREAGAVSQGVGDASATTAGQPAAVQRSVLGSVIGGVLGAVGGAALGFLAGGPLGAVLGGVLGAGLGAALGDAASSGARDLNAQERAEAKIVFGDSMDYDDVQVAEAPLLSIGGYARTPFTTVYFPPGSFKEPPDVYYPFLIHELTHVWQSQHGFSVLEKLFHALHGASAYDYGGVAGLRAAKREGKHFLDFNTEQQADILKDYYKRVKAGQDTSDYDMFVAEVQGTEAGADVKAPPAEAAT